MDRETNARLLRFGKGIPRDLLKKGLKKERPHQETLERLEAAQKDGRLPLDVRRKLGRVLSSEGVYNALRKETETIDLSVSLEIERRVEAQVRRDIRSGRLKKADTNDAFHKKIAPHFKGK